MELILFIVSLAIINSCSGNFEDDQWDLEEGWFTDEMYNDPYFVALRNQGYGLIVPGTKWCGEGSKAANYNDLGRYNRTDSCCRAHDNCKELMKPGETMLGLTNPSSSTSLSCKCDKEFYECLKEIKDYPSKTIGTIYFDILKKKCFHNNNGTYHWKDPVPFSEDSTNTRKLNSFGDFYELLKKLNEKVKPVIRRILVEMFDKSL